MYFVYIYFHLFIFMFLFFSLYVIWFVKTNDFMTLNGLLFFVQGDETMLRLSYCNLHHQLALLTCMDFSKTTPSLSRGGFSGMGQKIH